MFCTSFRTNHVMGEHVGVKIYQFFLPKEGHRGKITVYLDRIHQYLCAVKFL